MAFLFVSLENPELVGPRVAMREIRFKVGIARLFPRMG
jgi:hypothetical protein